MEREYPPGGGEHGGDAAGAGGAVASDFLFRSLIRSGDLYRWALHPEANETEVIRLQDLRRQARNGAAKRSPRREITRICTSDFDAQTEDEKQIPGPGNAQAGRADREKARPGSTRLFLRPDGGLFRLWSVIAMYYLRQSTRQDHRRRLPPYVEHAEVQRACRWCCMGFTVTLAAYDIVHVARPALVQHDVRRLLSSPARCQAFRGDHRHHAPDPAGADICKEAVTIEHYHDLGKYLFAFAFFFGYIAFSQYMLQWYASIPDELGWPARHGMSTANSHSDDLGNTVASVFAAGAFRMHFDSVPRLDVAAREA